MKLRVERLETVVALYPKLADYRKLLLELWLPAPGSAATVEIQQQCEDEQSQTESELPTLSSAARQ
jgi:hypothetical protein